MEQLLTIYKASAGSGKTFALAVEYIMGLLLPGAEKEFVHTLAVTFTNKATAEMKSRILETLYGLKMGLEESKPYMEAILKKTPSNSPVRGRNFSSTKSTLSLPSRGGLEGSEALRLQAGKALTAILHDYSHFRVETIDSFFQSILRNMARELGLAANLQVELSHDEVIESAVDSLIETMDEQPEVRQWVLDYVREQLDNGDKWDIVGPLKVLAGNIFREEYQQRSKEELSRISDPEVIKAFKSKMYAIRKEAEKDVAEAADEVMNTIDDFDQISYGKYLFNFLIDAKAMKSEGPSKSVLKAKYKNQKGDTSDLQARLAPFYALYAERRKEWLSTGLALRHLGPLRLLVSIDERAREIEGDTGRFTLSSTPALLSKMAQGSDAPFIFEKTATFINNVMIDEFQDTSRMQWENFKKLLFEKLASGGKGLLVGDIKQSIYRWRSGDWKILYNIEKEPQLQSFHIKPEPLDTNYRSHQVVVDFNNAFFPPAAKLLDEIKSNPEIELSQIYSDVEQKKKYEDGKGYVRINLFKETDDYVQDTVLDMASQIKQLQASGLELGKIAILVRKNETAQQLIEGFNQYAPDIRLISDEAFLLEASTSVQMIVAALRMLIDKHHTDGISEKYLMLHYLRDVLGKADTTIQDVTSQEAGQVLPEEFIAHQNELLQLPLYLLVERLWRIFSLNNIEGEDVYALTFFDELQSHLRGAGAPDIQTFLTAWDEKLRTKAIPGSAVAGIRILTIHKSKGLEFHTVFLPFSDWQIESDKRGDVLWCEAKEAPYDKLGALPISIQSKDVRTSVFADAYNEEHLERRVDALNTLYVAFTRAEYNLYVWGKTKPYKKVNSLSTAAELIYKTLRTEENDTDEECFSYETGKPDTSPTLEKKKESNRLRIEHCEKDAIDVKVVTRNPKLYFMQSNQAQDYLEQISLPLGGDGGGPHLSQRETGKRMHEVLSRINDVSQLDEVFAEAREEGLIGEGGDWDAITERIKEGFRNPLVASWFMPENTVYNECGIASINKDGLPQVLRPDRVVMTADSITVIDYKFGHPSRHYYDQVREYMGLMRQMYPKHNVQGYIWYVMGKGAVMVKR